MARAAARAANALRVTAVVVFVNVTDLNWVCCKGRVGASGCDSQGKEAQERNEGLQEEEEEEDFKIYLVSG